MSLDPKLVDTVYERDRWRCRHCGGSRLHPHHIQFKSHGGEDTTENLITLCACCHTEGIHGGHLRMAQADARGDRLIIFASGLNELDANKQIFFFRELGWKPTW